MADKDQYNDEYQFADLDAIEPDTVDASENTGVSPEAPKEPPTFSNKNDTKRKAMIVVGIVIFIMVIYEFVGAFTSEKKESAKTIVPAVITPTPIQVEPQPVVQPVVPPAPAVDVNVTQKLSALELTQQSMRSDVSSVNDQLGGINTNVNALIAKMAELNGVIASLSAKVDEQSREIEQLTIRRVEAKRVHTIVHKAPQYPKYYIQAVIPGRAWLIATNGATLTVREGTVIAGYGLVKLIDPNQGRILTSSGQVIRFSQEDS